MLGFGILIPLVPYMADRFGVPPQLITPILGSYSLCQLLAAPLWGRLSDRYGRRPILMSSLAGACVSYLLLGCARNLGWLLATLAAATLLVTYSQSILESIFAIFAMHRYGFGPRTVGLLLFAAALPALVMQGGAVRILAPRLGEARLAMCGVFVYVAGLVILGEAPALEAAIAGLVLCGIGLGAYNPSAFALASKQSRGHDRGAVLGAYAASASLARVIGPFTSGPIYALLGAERKSVG